MKATLLLTLWAVSSLMRVEGQRLSTGASDWYMRFHDFDMVKRHVDDRPVIRLFHVGATVQHRFAVTKVATVVHNPSKLAQVYQFGLAMPRSSFVTSVTLSREGDGGGGGGRRQHSVRSEFGESRWLESDGGEEGQYGPGGRRRGPAGGQRASRVLSRQSLGSLSSDIANFKQFVLPIRLLPNDNVTLVLQYEHLLERQDGKYEYVASISPGELVRDFSIELAIEEDLSLSDVNVSAPVIGNITGQGRSVTSANGTEMKVSFSMTEMEQYDYFGAHGFTGDFTASFDVKPPFQAGVDLTAAGDTFLHFYDVPEPMQGIPKHVIFLVDDSESMTGPKAEHARESVALLLSSLSSERDYVNLLFFNDSVTPFYPGGFPDDGNATVMDHAFAADENATSALVGAMSNLGNSSGPSNLTLAITAAMKLDSEIWEAGNLPENAYTIIVLITDGRSSQAGGMSEKRRIVQHVTSANRIARIPIFILGMGFDADMEFLGEISDKAGGMDVNVIEDLEVSPQLALVRGHLDQVVLKNLHLNYVGDAFSQATITNSKVLAFRAGTSVAVAGRLRPDVAHPEFEVEATGQSDRGLFMHLPATVPLSPDGKPACSGEVTLCSRADLAGDCITVSESRSSLRQLSFGNRAASARVTGDCVWTAFPRAHYLGDSFPLVPGTFSLLPELLHKDISSLKAHPLASYALGGAEKVDQGEGEEDGVRKDKFSAKAATAPAESTGRATQDEENKRKAALLERVWAYLTIRDVLRKLEFRPELVSLKEAQAATTLSLRHGFLTPFTELYLIESEGDEYSSATPTTTTSFPDEAEEEQPVEPTQEALVVENLIAYKDLSPVFLSLDDDPHIKRQWEALRQCLPPIACIGNFHLEMFPDEHHHSGGRGEGGPPPSQHNCTGALTMFTKPGHAGESLTVTSSVHQVYHSTNAQRMRSLSVTGRCCWLLFDRRFFAGRVEKVCGDASQELRFTNVGSAKRIGPPAVTESPATTTEAPPLPAIAEATRPAARTSTEATV